MLLSAILAVEPNVSPIYKGAFTIPAIVMESTMVCKMLRAMVIRSLDVDLNGALAPTEASGLGLDTSLELDLWTTNIEPDQAR